MKQAIQHINPDGLAKSPAFSQAIITQGNGRTLYIGGQNGKDEKGEIVGSDLKTQTEKTLQNIQVILDSCHATFEHIVKLSIYLVDGQDPRIGFEAYQKFIGKSENPPTITVLMVAGLGPGALVEIDAVAFLPDK